MAWRSIVALAALACALTGCGNGSDGGGGGSGGSVATRSSAVCGSVPTSSGPASGLATLRVTAPVSAAAGSDVPVQASVAVRTDGGRILTDESRSLLLVTKDGAVVGRATSTGSALLVPLQLTGGAARPAQVVPGSVRLSDCASGSPLPPGQYGIVAVLGYGQDPLNAAPEGSGGAFALVSEPAPLTVQ